MEEKIEEVTEFFGTILGQLPEYIYPCQYCPAQLYCVDKRHRMDCGQILHDYIMED